MVKRGKIGKIIIPGNMKPWPHELAAARVLAENGYDVEFIRKSEQYKTNSADLKLNNKKIWELKSPKADSLKAVERNVKRGRNQSPRVIISGLRFSNFSDEVIMREIVSSLKRVDDIEKLKYISKRRKVVDVK